MKRCTPLSVAFVLLAFAACEQQVVGPQDGPDFSNAQNVVHQVSVGGPDICESLGLPNGCDANFSLVAQLKADGTGSGQWTDVFRTPNGTIIHVTIDCLFVSGNTAWVSGVVTGHNATGAPVITEVVDNGKSANDTPDQISYTQIDTYGGCSAAPDLELYDMPKGQVTVR